MRYKSFKILCNIPGYLRIKMNPLATRAFSSEWQNFVYSILSLPGTSSVKSDPLTKSILIRYQSEVLKEKTLLKEIASFSRKTQKPKKDLLPPFFKGDLKVQPIEVFKNKYKLVLWQTVSDIPGRLRIKHPFLCHREQCCQQIERALFNTPGVERVKASPLTGSMLVIYEPKKISKEKLVDVAEQVFQKTTPSQRRKKTRKITRFDLSSLTTGLTFLLKGASFWTLPLIAYTAWPIYKKAIQGIREKKMKVDILDAVVITGCLLSGEMFFASFMVWAVSLGDKLLGTATSTSRKLLGQIFGQQPRFAWLARDGQEIEVSVESLKKGDVIVVSAGQSIPIDGEIIRGEAMIDQHMLTGESAPQEKKRGDEVLSMTSVLEGRILIRVQKTGQETVAGKITKIVSSTANYKTKYQSKGERIADKAVLPTLGLAGVASVTAGRSGALAVINADYGTGIRIASPTALMCSLIRSAQQGIIIKNGASLEMLSGVKTFLFDKTGTLTNEIPEVSRVISARKGIKEKEILFYTAAVEQRMSHPIARAIINKAEEEKLKMRLPARGESRYYLGYGMRATVKNKLVRVGNLRFLEKGKVSIPTSILKEYRKVTSQGHSAVLTGINQELIGLIELRNTERPDAYWIIQELRRRGVEKIVLISGDHQGPTEELAKKLDVDDFYAEVLPHQKGNIVKQYRKQGRVAMVGDGINDGPALSLADVSISLKGASNIALDTADIIFMDGDFRKIDLLYDISDNFNRNVKHSFYMIAIPNTICILGAIGRLITLGGSILLNNCFNLAAIFNSLRPLGQVPARDVEFRSKLNNNNHGGRTS